jgi:hypothetical protein
VIRPRPVVEPKVSGDNVTATLSPQVTVVCSFGNEAIGKLISPSVTRFSRC